MYELYNQEKITEYVHYELMQESREEGRAEGRAEGMTAGMTAGMVEGVLSSARGLMESMGWSAQQAMKAMKVPESDYQKYLDRLAN